MALSPNSCNSNVVFHCRHLLGIISETPYVPSDLIKLTMDIDLLDHDPIRGYFNNPFSQGTLGFDLNVLQNCGQVHQVLDPVFMRLGINIVSASYNIMIQEIMECMTRALEESASGFESNNYGMVAANESSMEKMLKRVGVKAGVEQDCMICLDLKLLRCHVLIFFMVFCIEQWLKQSHYCPICRFEMPTN
ncbi:hypothetical protein F3Y22_tig00111779pilonHSYRG00372 [Hibiscus syriacus]|uniref:RING-type E3 ubiquitin transferase n=1 Tax=Hibiscus syriacus TaxID=106335 RepID=A0A6A2XDF9_HIBSY|nr:hypothetical protein F3Y22_tig00111779pilonHSYRG00372 [Hibiscus syriacus]